MRALFAAHGVPDDEIGLLRSSSVIDSVRGVLPRPVRACAVRACRWSGWRTTSRTGFPTALTETRELAWFAKHFVGEQSFILLTWEGCSEQDESYKLFVEKLTSEIQPDDEETITDEQSIAALSASDEDLSPHEQRAAGTGAAGASRPAMGRSNWGSSPPATTTSTGVAWTKSGSRAATDRGTTSRPTAISSTGMVARMCWAASAG